MYKHEMLDANMQMMLCNAMACQSELLDPLEHLSGCTAWREIKRIKQSTPNKGHGMDHVILNINHQFLVDYGLHLINTQVSLILRIPDRINHESRVCCKSRAWSLG